MRNHLLHIRFYDLLYDKFLRIDRISIRLSYLSVNTVQMCIKMQQIQVIFQTLSNICIHVESNQILNVITVLNTLPLCDFN